MRVQDKMISDNNKSNYSMTCLSSNFQVQQAINEGSKTQNQFYYIYL